MGDPRKIRNKYSTPMHPWQLGRLEAEKPLMKTYGLTNKKELWKIGSKLTKYKDNAKKLVVRKGEQADIERKQLVKKLKSFNLIKTDALDEILELGVEELLDRRIQSLLFKKGLARSIKQSRQMITHGHVNVGGKKMTSPGYLVRLSEEGSISFNPGSGFHDAEHPERSIPELTEASENKVKPDEKKDSVKEKPKKQVKEEKPQKEESKVEEKTNEGHAEKN